MSHHRMGRYPIEEQPGEGSSFNLKNIRTLLTEGFTDEELRRLCYDNPEFRPVFEQLSQEMGKDRVIDKLIEYAERKELLENLLAIVKELNLAGYEKHQPYYDIIAEPVPLGDATGKSHERRPSLPIPTIIGAVTLLIMVGGIFFFVRGDIGRSALPEAAPDLFTDEPTKTSKPPTHTPEPISTLTLGGVGTADRPIKVLFVPSLDTSLIVNGGEVMVAALNKETGLNFVVDVPASYEATIEGMCASPEDTIGFIPAMGYIIANRRCGIEVGAVVVRFGYSWYSSQILVSRDSDIQSLNDLAGKKWAVPDRSSTSTYFYPLMMFQNAGIELGDLVEVGTHSQSVMWVYNGGASFSTSFFRPPLTDPAWQFGDDPESYDVNNVIRTEGGHCFAGEIRILDARCSVIEVAPDVFEKTRILTLTPQIPNDTISFAPEFPAELKGMIIDALDEFASSEACNQSICSDDLYNWEGFEPIEDTFYDPVRNLIDVFGYTEEDILGN